MTLCAPMMRITGRICYIDREAPLYRRMLELVPTLRDRAQTIMGEQVGRYGQYQQGYRWANDRRVVDRTIASMASDGILMSEQDCNAAWQAGCQAETSEQKICEWLVEGLLEAARADHWYTYEKEW